MTPLTLTLWILAGCGSAFALGLVGTLLASMWNGVVVMRRRRERERLSKVGRNGVRLDIGSLERVRAMCAEALEEKRSLAPLAPDDAIALIDEVFHARGLVAGEDPGSADDVAQARQTAADRARAGIAGAVEGWQNEVRVGPEVERADPRWPYLTKTHFRYSPGSRGTVTLRIGDQELVEEYGGLTLEEIARAKAAELYRRECSPLVYVRAEDGQPIDQAVRQRIAREFSRWWDAGAPGPMLMFGMRLDFIWPHEQDGGVDLLRKECDQLAQRVVKLTAERDQARLRSRGFKGVHDEVHSVLVHCGLPNIADLACLDHQRAVRELVKMARPPAPVHAEPDESLELPAVEAFPLQHDWRVLPEVVGQAAARALEKFGAPTGGPTVELRKVWLIANDATERLVRMCDLEIGDRFRLDGGGAPHDTVEPSQVWVATDQPTFEGGVWGITAKAADGQA